jgi:uncharacterized protein YndB with AHSA1/START domain
VVQTQHSADVVEREVRIAARPDTVFEYLTQPDKLVEWAAPVVEADPRPGGVVRFNYNGFDIARGEFVELTRPTRVVFTWGWESLADATRPGQSTVEISLRADGDGTLLRLVHRGLKQHEVAPHAEGWGTFMEALAGRFTPTPSPAPQLSLAGGEAVASRMNTLLIELRDTVATAGAKLGARCAAEGWTAGATALHALSHAQAIAALRASALGRTSPVEEITIEAVHAKNASDAEANAGAGAADIAGKLEKEGAATVSAVRDLSEEALATKRRFTPFGGAELAVGDVMRRLLDDLADHVASVRAALGAR